jgi:hypothetical protein
MKLLDVAVERVSDQIRVVGHIEKREEQPYVAFPRAMQDLVSDTADAFVPALLVPCLESGKPLEIVPPVSPRLAGRIPHIIDLLLALFPSFHRVEVKVHARQTAETSTGNWVATLFSGGVDSFYTLLKGLEPETSPDLRPTHLLFMRGLEQRLDESDGAGATHSVVEDVANAVGLNVLSGETNLRMLFPLNYELYYHAAALIASGIVLSGGVKRLLVPSTYSYGQMIPWGSHPILDELWSTDAVEVIHHGAEARRVDKIAQLVGHHPLALERLRVCLDNQAGPVNCGRCKKCARTIMALEIAGTLDGAQTFPKVSRRALARSLCADSPIFVEELRDLALRTGRTDALDFLNSVIRRQKRRFAVKALIESTPVLTTMMPQVNRLRRLCRRHGAD